MLFVHSALVAALGAAQTLVRDVDGDPFARKDPFDDISEADLHAKWSVNDLADERTTTSLHTLADRLEALDYVRETTYIDVRLAGFQGEGERDVQLGEESLQRLLDAAAHETAAHVIRAHSPSTSHELPVRRRFLYRVSTASPALATDVAAAIERLADRNSGGVPLSAVDSLVREDYQKRHSSHVTLYLLNPRAPRRGPSVERGGGASSSAAGRAGWDAPRVRYSYLDDGVGEEAASGRRVGACPLTRWVGRERYLWIDLTAGPVSYGPSTSAADVISEQSLPSLAHLARRFTDAAEITRHLAVELAALAATSAHTLLLPPLAALQEPMVPSDCFWLRLIASDCDPAAVGASRAHGAF